LDKYNQCVSSGNCGTTPNGDIGYCYNGNWMSASCTCLTGEYPTCQSLGFMGSCGLCEGEVCSDPPGAYVTREWCYGNGCDFPDCNSGNCGAFYVCQGRGWYCVYDSGWKWEASHLAFAALMLIVLLKTIQKENVILLAP